jgi:hypothetical protein
VSLGEVIEHAALLVADSSGRARARIAFLSGLAPSITHSTPSPTAEV